MLPNELVDIILFYTNDFNLVVSVGTKYIIKKCFKPYQHNWIWAELNGCLKARKWVQNNNYGYTITIPRRGYIHGVI